MRIDSQRFRWLEARLPAPDTRRLVVVTGARQTGKTTLVRGHYPDLRYINFDALEDRERAAAIRTAAWLSSVGPAVLDEAQKAPAVFDKVKHAYDARDIDFSVLLGSSRLLLLDQVRESLAGRAFPRLQPRSPRASRGTMAVAGRMSPTTSRLARPILSQSFAIVTTYGGDRRAKPSNTRSSPEPAPCHVPALGRPPYRVLRRSRAAPTRGGAASF